MAWAAWAPYAVMGISTITSMAAAEEQGKAAAAANRRQAEALEEKAETVKASGQRNMLRERRNTELVASRAIALSAASGGLTTSPDIVNIIADIHGEGAYRESVAMYEAEQQAYDMKQEANLLRQGASDAATAGSMRAAAIGLRGASSMYDLYDRRNPTTPDTGFRFYDFPGVK